MKNHDHNKNYCAICDLNLIAPLLPVQGPIKDFIHQNILVSFLDEPFDKAVKKASELYEARAFMDFCYYRKKFSEGVISEKWLRKSLDFHLPLKFHPEKEIFYRALFNFDHILDEKSLYFLAKQQGINHKKVANLLSLVNANQKNVPNYRILRPLIVKQAGNGFNHEVHQLLFRLLASFVDQGVSLWPYLNQDINFTEAIAKLAKSSSAPLKAWLNNDELHDILSIKVEDAIPSLLKKLLGCQSLYHIYLQELLLAHPGWSGMVNVISQSPNGLNYPCHIDIAQLALVKLALEYQYIKNTQFNPISVDDYTHEKNKTHRSAIIDNLSIVWFLCSNNEELSFDGTEFLSSHFLQKVWQRALENTYYDQTSTLLSNGPKSTLSANRSIQAVFCMDDRECSLRRFLEQEDPELESFGTAGFFGIDCYLQASDSLPQKICPPLATPKHVVTEVIKSDAVKNSALVDLAIFMTRHGANSTLFGFLSACTIGHLSLFRLMSSFLHPFKWQKSHHLLKESPVPPPQYERTEDKQINGLFYGYSVQEMADRIYGTLRNMGLSKDFSPLVLIFGHVSSSMNNPHFAAYDCGACSGRSGAINARVFCAMANRQDVRELVCEKGIAIPDETIFIGGVHNTCNDEIEYFKDRPLSSIQEQLFQRFKAHAMNALGKNAEERCKKFALHEKNSSPQLAIKEVMYRSKALFEPRPELGHATNAMLIVGRRKRSYGIHLDRRALLQSYDPSIDATGSILNTVLSAAIPVCAGINLDYYFSRLDPAIYGCGSKLSHNVVSLIGVGNGLYDDLRTGLSIQMTEMHDPIRLFVVIEQSEDIIGQVIKNNPLVNPWVMNDWVKLASLDPTENIINVYDPKTSSWHAIDAATRPLC